MAFLGNLIWGIFIATLAASMVWIWGWDLLLGAGILALVALGTSGEYSHHGPRLD